MLTPPRPSRIPLWVKLLYTGFMAVLIPTYWYYYGVTNFLYFCDIALFLALAAIWLESPLLASIPCVGILVPQVLWCVDFMVTFCGGRFVKMTDDMFEAERSLFLRGLSFFHYWLPFLLVFLVWRLGYDRRAFLGWTLLAWVLMLFSYAYMPAPPIDKKHYQEEVRQAEMPSYKESRRLPGRTGRWRLAVWWSCWLACPWPVSWWATGVWGAISSRWLPGWPWSVRWCPSVRSTGRLRQLRRCSSISRSTSIMSITGTTMDRRRSCIRCSI